MDVIIAGAGIGGLTTALALHAAGIDDVTLYESAPELRPLGVGINLLPHAVRELTELGLGERLATIGVATSTLTYFNRYGQEIWSEPRGLAAGYDWAQYSVHRGRLQLMLRDAVVERLGADAIRLGCTVDDAQDDGERASVRVTEHGGPEKGGTVRRASADVVVGADGIHSALRRQRHPGEGAPVWNGLILWRGTARVAPYLDGRTMIMAGDAQQKFVAYPLSAPGDDGLQVVNFIAEYRSDDDEPGASNWNRSADPSTVLGRFVDWGFGWLDVPAVIGAADEILEYPMVDRDPIPRWTFGRQTLLGDAAHAMYPIGSNGASQAIIDARTLGYELGTKGPTQLALDAYEAERRPRTTQLTLSNRSMGPERVMQLAYERAPGGFDDIELVVPFAERAAIAARYKSAGGFVPEQLNRRASLSVPASARGQLA
ncbi:flavin-dependent oxidoreductase [Agromyces humatus]|uniref:Flavin-dependent oxidoreductase n=1 Tax=Agromyces humatus TaxID=279573 RepID=A0ABN2KC01_9MICO|nr:flavin-dependent oxidoreductase [Agromyces humatus]